jgi:hypothetical protein
MFKTEYISTELSKWGLDEFFQKFFVAFVEEIDLLYRTFFSFRTEEVRKDVFSMIEQTWVGLLNDAIKRIDINIPTMQEFSVWENNKGIGRCDYLFRWTNKKNATYDIITEVKQFECVGNWKYEHSKEFYSKIEKQARKYYQAEKHNYQQEVLTMTIAFEWIRYEGHMEKMLKTLDEFDGSIDEHTHFIKLIGHGNKGIIIYGNIIEVK